MGPGQFRKDSFGKVIEDIADSLGNACRKHPEESPSNSPPKAPLNRSQSPSCDGCKDNWLSLSKGNDCLDRIEEVYEKRANCRKKIEGIPARIGVFEGVVEDVAVAVVALQIALELDDGVGREEAPERGVVDALLARAGIAGGLASIMV